MSVQFAISLTDKVTGPANNIAGAFSHLERQASRLQGELGSLEQKMRMASAAGDVEKLRTLSNRYTDVQGKLAGVNLKMQNAADGTDILTGALDALGGNARIAQVGFGLLAAAAAAMGAALVKGAQEVVAANEALNKMRATFDALAGGGGAAVVGIIDSLRAKLGMTRAELAPLAEQLLAMGVPAGKLTEQLTALASIKAIGITGGTEAYLGLLKKLEGQTKVSGKSLADLYKTGVNVNEIAAKLGLSVKQLQAELKNGTLDANKFKEALASAITGKGASALAEQSNSLTAQLALFQENVTKLFEGINIRPFLESLKSLLGIVDSNTASGKALHFLLKQLFEGLFSAASKVLPYVKTFLLGMVIGALKFYVALKPLIKEFQNLTLSKKGAEELRGKLNSLGESVFVIATAAAKSAAAFLRMYELASKAISGIESLLGGGGKGIGSSFVDGIVSGIEGAAGAAVASVKDLGTSLMTAIKGTLGIHSPSREMMKLGAFTAQGFAQGISSASDNVAAAGAGMSTQAPKGAMSVGGGGGRGSGDIALTVQVNGGSGDAKETAKAVVEAVVDVFEQIGLTEGISVAT